MDAVAALLERPVLELAMGAALLIFASMGAAIVFFWLGFRIAEVPALAGFEAMFGLSDGSTGGNATVVPREVASRLEAIKNRAKAASERSSLGELAAATELDRAARTGTDRPVKVARIRKIDE